MNYTYTDELYHHGILGQKWGKKNGPPYPLGENQKSAKEKRLDSERSDNFKRYAKIGASVAIAGLAVYGAYKYGPQIVDAAKRGASVAALSGTGGVETQSLVIDDKARDISERTGLPLKDKYYSVDEDINILREARKQDGVARDTDCGPLALNFCLRRMGLDVTSEHPDQMSLAELGHYFKGIRTASKAVDISSFENNSQIKNEIVRIATEQAADSDNAVGLIEIRRDNVGHFTTWYKENGEIKFDDIQSDSSFIDKAPFKLYSDIKVARLDNLEVKANNLLGSKTDPDIVPITKKRRDQHE